METIKKHEPNVINKIKDDQLITPILKELFKDYDAFVHFLEQCELNLYNTTVVFDNGKYLLEFVCDIDFTKIHGGEYSSYFTNIQPTTVFISDNTEVEVSPELIDNLFNA